MANSKLALPKQIELPMLGAIHQKHPEVGKALQIIMEYLRKNLPPVQGNKVAQ